MSALKDGLRHELGHDQDMPPPYFEGWQDAYPSESMSYAISDSL